MTPLVLGTAKGVPGQLTHGLLSVAEAPDGPINTEVYLATGIQPGPVLWVQSLIHGDEVGGYLGLSQFLRNLNLEEFAGTVIALPAVNPAAYRAWSRTVPFDGENLNRCFPGNPQGGHSQQIAHSLLTTALELADVVVDLHSGGANCTVPLYALYWENGSAASAESYRLAQATGTGVTWRTQDDWLVGGMFRHVVEAGKPSVIVECGGGTSIAPSEVADFAASLHGIAHALGMQSSVHTRPTPEKEIILGASDLVFNTRAGIFVTEHQAGAILEPGAMVGQIHDFLGNVIETIHAPQRRTYLAALRNNNFPLHNGELICEAMELSS